MIDFVHLFCNYIEDHTIYLKDEKKYFVEGIIFRNKDKIKYFWHKDLHTGCLTKVGYKNWIDFTGSITKYWYNENYSNLPYSDLACTVYELADSLKKRPNELTIRSFEYGLNIPMILDLKALELTELALNYKNKFFQDMDDKSKKPSIGKKCKLQQYQIKLYSKSMQYRLPTELLRYEIKTSRLAYLKEKELTLKSLINKDFLILLRNDLINKMENILFYDDSIDISKLNSKEKNLCLNWKSLIYRKKLLKNNYFKFNYEKKKMIDIINKHGKNQITFTLISQITETWNELMEN